MINEQAQSYDIPIVGIDVQPPNAFHTNDLYFKYLISVLVYKIGSHRCNNNFKYILKHFMLFFIICFFQVL